MASYGQIVIGATENGGTALPKPALNGIAIANEPIWSSKTGRNSSGNMIGDIIAWKKTISITWGPLSFSDAALIRDTIINAGAFFKLWYYDTNTSSGTPVRTSSTVYCGNIPRTLYSLASGKRLHSGLTIQFIEQ